MGKNYNKRRNRPRDRRSSFTEDDNYYKKKSPRPDSSRYKSDNRLGRIEKRNRNHKKDTRSDRPHQYRERGGRRRHFATNSFESPVKRRKPSNKFDDFYRKNVRKPSPEGRFSRLVLPRSVSPAPQRNRVFIDTKIPFIPIVELSKEWTSESGNRTTVYDINDFHAEFSRTTDVDSNIVDGYNYEKKNLENYLRKINATKINSGKENICKRNNHQLPLACNSEQSTLPGGNDDVPNSTYSGFLPYSKGSSGTSEMRKASNAIARAYRYDRCPASYPVSYKHTLEYKNERSSHLVNGLVDDVAYDPITKSTLTKNIMFRSFEHVNDPVDSHDSCIFSFKSYNILSQTAAMNHPEMYTHLTVTKDDGCVEVDGVLSEQDRYKKLLSELTTFRTDIMCLQECDKLFYDNMLNPEMEKFGYKGEFLLKSFPESPDGCATFYSNKFKLVNKNDVRYLEYTAGHDTKPQVAQILEFEINSDDTKSPEDRTRLFVANTHIIYNPKRGDIKLSQVACLLANLQDMLKKCKNPYAYIMCGDFNMQPYSRMYNFIVDGECKTIFDKLTFSGQIPPKSGGLSKNLTNNRLIRGSLFDHSCTLVDKNGGDYYSSYTHRLSFASVYKHYTGKQKKPEISTYHTCDASNPDYIFYGVSMREVYRSAVLINETTKLSLLKRLSLPTDCEIAQNLGPMPNSLTGSDHLPLIAHFQMR